MGNRVREARKAAGLTQVELAKRAGTTQPYLSILERGVVRPRLETAIKVARALSEDLVVADPKWRGALRPLEVSDLWEVAS